MNHQLISVSDRTYPAGTVLALMLASLCYLALMSFLNARGLHISAGSVALAEALIYAGCLLIQLQRLPQGTMVFALGVFCAMVIYWMWRQSIDLKGLRDFLIPILFISLGRFVADPAFAQRSLRTMVWVVVVLGLLEVVFLDSYARLFNTFSFYVNLGGINEGSAMFEGQMLTLNGYRPSGIGRTLLPQLLGPHRASSVLMEPVSLGNFAVIVLAWALSQSWDQIRRSGFLIFSAVLLIVLSDSRFGMVMGLALLAFRGLPDDLRNRVSPLLPFLILGTVLVIGLSYPAGADNFLGRVSTSGNAVLRFDWKMLLGGFSPLPNYGDMGFAYVLSRFGAPLATLCCIALFLVPMRDRQGERFRSMVVLYLFCLLAISGTSIFALKTAGLMWFLFGILCTPTAVTGVRPQHYAPAAA